MNIPVSTRHSHAVIIAGVCLCLTGSARAGLIARWVADDWPGTAAWYDRVSGIAANVLGAPTVAPGSFGFTSANNGIVFDGTGDAFTVATNPLGGQPQVTTIATLKSTTPSSSPENYQWSGPIGGEVVDNPNDYFLVIDNLGRGVARVSLGIKTTHAVVTDGAIHTLALTWFSDSIDPVNPNLALFLDGVQVGAAVGAGMPGGLVTSGFAIGGDKESPTFFFTGEIAEVRMYDSIEDVGILNAAMTIPIPEPAARPITLAALGIAGWSMQRRRARPASGHWA